MKTLVLIGGTFNPFTNAHKAMAAKVREVLPEADIIYVPSNLKYIAKWKNLPAGTVFSGENRVDLIRESIKDINRCFVTDKESNGELSGKTYDTVQYYKAHYDTIYICIGSDKLDEIGKWYKAEELLKEVKILHFTRGESIRNCKSEFVNQNRDRIAEVAFDYPEVSSSLVRGLYERGNMEVLRKYVPEPVYQYLKREKGN